jgi:hypothetical protein
MPEEKKITGWAQVNITPDMPLGLIVNFLNVLNQRLVTIENVVTVQGPDGKMMSLTDLYALQSEEEAKQAQAQEDQAPKGE